MRVCYGKRLGVVLVGTVLLTVGYLLSAAGDFPGVANAQPKPDSQTKACPSPTPSLLANQTAPVAEPTGSGSTLVSTPVAPASTSTASLSIEQLVEQLQALRARKAELDRQEKQVVAALKDKLKEQQQRLQKLGINAGTNEAP